MDHSFTSNFGQTHIIHQPPSKLSELLSYRFLHPHAPALAKSESTSRLPQNHTMHTIMQDYAVMHYARASPRSFDCGGGDGFIGTQTHLPQNLVSPRISDTFFIFVMLENAKIVYVWRKKILKNQISRGAVSVGFQKSEVLVLTPVPPSPTPLPLCSISGGALRPLQH